MGMPVMQRKPTETLTILDPFIKAARDARASELAETRRNPGLSPESQAMLERATALQTSTGHLPVVYTVSAGKRTVSTQGNLKSALFLIGGGLLVIFQALGAVPKPQASAPAASPQAPVVTVPIQPAPAAPAPAAAAPAPVPVDVVAPAPVGNAASAPNLGQAPAPAQAPAQASAPAPQPAPQPPQAAPPGGGTGNPPPPPPSGGGGSQPAPQPPPAKDPPPPPPSDSGGNTGGGGGTQPEVKDQNTGNCPAGTYKNASGECVSSGDDGDGGGVG